MLVYEIDREDNKELELYNIENVEAMLDLIRTSYDKATLNDLSNTLRTRYPDIETYLLNIGNALKCNDLPKLREAILDLFSYTSRIDDNLPEEVSSIFTKVTNDKKIEYNYTVALFLKYAYLALTPVEFRELITFLKNL